MNKKIKKELQKDKKEKVKYNWIIKIIITAFIIAFVFSTASELILPKVNLFVGILIVLLFIFLGVIFDMIGVAVTAADEAPFHAMASRKINGAKIAVKLKKNADKVSTFCNDVVGDICGIISGAGGAVISVNISESLNLNSFIVAIIITSIISALTIGGKAVEKSYAINKSNEILYNASKVLSIFIKR